MLKGEITKKSEKWTYMNNFVLLSALAQSSGGKSKLKKKKEESLKEKT